MRKKIVITLVYAVILLIPQLTPVYSQTCPLCKLSLMNSPEGRHIAKAFNSGILFLLAMPYLIAATLGFLILKLKLGRKS